MGFFLLSDDYNKYGDNDGIAMIAGGGGGDGFCHVSGVAILRGGTPGSGCLGLCPQSWAHGRLRFL